MYNNVILIPKELQHDLPNMHHYSNKTVIFVSDKAKYYFVSDKIVIRQSKIGK
jgi:ABC-type proline/glycine betaine transport system ATPase subunit